MTRPDALVTGASHQTLRLARYLKLLGQVSPYRPWFFNWSAADPSVLDRKDVLFGPTLSSQACALRIMRLRRLRETERRPGNIDSLVAGRGCAVRRRDHRLLARALVRHRARLGPHGPHLPTARGSAAHPPRDGRHRLLAGCADRCRAHAHERRRVSLTSPMQYDTATTYELVLLSSAALVPHWIHRARSVAGSTASWMSGLIALRWRRSSARQLCMRMAGAWACDGDGRARRCVRCPATHAASASEQHRANEP